MVRAAARRRGIVSSKAVGGAMRLVVSPVGEGPGTGRGMACDGGSPGRPVRGRVSCRGGRSRRNASPARRRRCAGVRCAPVILNGSPA
ncbi:hypothetical protein DPR00_19340 [Burkholderia pseudomallei]|uniref:Uncharacterized protein n=1 Tax=Burkholderia pseudomallei TaxID=28450 RepID=A0AAX0U1T2_BURPE|nr:hypothetical protein BHT10_31550 [Burkholderia pseudomallei]EDS82619.1 hypothetical protein BURPSS13_T0237 [Burkholderia pseudomallei S13]MPT65140.1 hypothetical protein [Burkholderia pseudomallei]MPT69716.1 hypothetical protein [Burkholderia pseudomallei]MPT74642.1 hypothetical protein [Burkholderia pseudomallei]